MNEQPIKIAIADPSLLIREGLKSIISGSTNAKIVKEFETASDLIKGIKKPSFNQLIFDYQALGLNEVFLENFKKEHPEIKVFCITNDVSSIKLELIIRTGVQAHLFKDCDRDEIIDAVNKIHEGEHFFCGKVLEALTELEKGNRVNYSCKGLNISVREAEIIQLIAEGLTNKEIADKLFLSSHTVNTHRKKIMAKLGIGNTAGLVMYAIKENLVKA